VLLEQIIDLLIDMAGPVGPLRSVMDQLDARDRAVDGIKPEDVGALFELAANPPPQASWIDKEDWLFVIAETVIVSARRNREAYVPKIVPYLSQPEHRLLALQVLSGVGDLPSLEGISSLVENAEGLSEEELLWLVCVVGESAHAEAESHLDRITQIITRQSEEIGLGLAAARNRIRNRSQPLPTLRELYKLLINIEAG